MGLCWRILHKRKKTAYKGMSMKEDIISILVEYRDKIHDGNTDLAAKALGVNAPTLWRWLNGKNVPKVESLNGF